MKERRKTNLASKKIQQKAATKKYPLKIQQFRKCHKKFLEVKEDLDKIIMNAL